VTDEWFAGHSLPDDDERKTFQDFVGDDFSLMRLEMMKMIACNGD